MPVFNNMLAGASGGAGGAGYEIERSLRFNSGDSATLTRTPSSTGNRKTWTWSGWVKRSSVTGTAQEIFRSTSGGASFWMRLLFTTDDKISFHETYNNLGNTTQVYRDPSAWYHIVLVFDTTQASNNVVLYVNNVQQRTWSLTQNFEGAINSTYEHVIANYAGLYSDFYLADVHFIDGQALTADDFGAPDDNGVWQPKKYSGTYGTNGFHLDFADNSSNAALGTDTSGNSNTWTVNNLNASVAVANAIDLDGNDQIEFPGPGDGISGDFTMECFFLMDSSASGFQRIFSTNEGSYSDEQTMIRRNSSGNIAFSAGNSSPTYFDHSSGHTITSGVWHHAAIVRESGTVSFYYDGTRKTSASYSTSFDITKLVVGGGYGSENFNGDVHGARFTLGQALYSGSSYTVPTSPITTTSQSATASNVKVLAGTTSTVNENAGTLGNGTNSGDPTAASAYPFGDPVNIDSLVDTPTNGDTANDTGAGGEVVGNYATLNPLQNSTGDTFSDGNLTVNTSSSNYGTHTSTIATPLSGKWYAEVKVVSTSGFATVGIVSADSTFTATSWPGSLNGAAYYSYNGERYIDTATQGAAATFGANDVIGIAYDADSSTVTFYKNGASQGTLTSIPLRKYFFGGSDYDASGSVELDWNFGQRAFAYTAPSGYKALCTSNLPEPAIADGSKYFDTTLWGGNDTQRDITGLGFSPDLTWIKQRSGGTANHSLMDTVRGATKNLVPNDSQNQGTEPGYLNAFLSDGFSIGTSSVVNDGNSTYCAWAWDAGTNSDKTYTVTVSGGNFYIDGAQQPTLTLAEGSTYKFDQADSSNATHPLRFSTTSDGTHGAGLEYTTGVTTAGTPGSAGAYTQIVIPSPAPTLFAYCTNHSGMGFQVSTGDTAGFTVPAGSYNNTYYDRSKSWISLVTTSALSSSYNAYSATSKLGALDGKRSTALYGVGGQALTITFNASAFPASGGPYIVEAENNQRAITLNGLLTGTPWPLQATGWQKFDPVSTITTISCAAASAHYGGMINRIRVNGKVLADPTATPDNVPSVSTQVLASPESGFSISKWAGTGSEATVAHGLNSAPQFYFAKSLDNAESWDGITTVLPTNPLDNAALDQYGVFSNSYHEVPTSLYIGRPSGDSSNEDMIAYNFAPVEGFSAMGVHTNGGSNCQDFIYTGFRPAWILARAQIAEWWHIFDSKRNPSNPMTQKLWANVTDAESPQDGFDFLSNGFKVIAADNNFFASGVNYTWIWMAFAEHPFKNARAR